jgi:GT2 family glycosyltransferase
MRKVLGKSKYHLVLNPDIEFEPSILDSLFHFMQQRPTIGLVMPKVLYRNGEMQHLCKMLPSPFDLVLRRFVPGPLKMLFRSRLERYELKHIDYNKTMQIPNMSGCFMFLRTEALEQVGIFDERFFMYLEDTDLCRRINSYYQTIYYPVVSIVHGYSKASYKSFKLLRHHLTSSIRYFNKWGWLSDPIRNDINNSVLTFRYLPKLSLQNRIGQTEQESRGAILRVLEHQRIANNI